MKYRMFEYEVQGGGTFPFDMLRYDSCWPSRQEDVTKAFHSARQQGRRTVMISGVRAPTNDRWKSFGWTVKGSVIKRTIEQLSGG